MDKSRCHQKYQFTHNMHTDSLNRVLPVFVFFQPERIDPPDPTKPDYDIRADVWSLGISLVKLLLFYYHKISVLALSKWVLCQSGVPLGLVRGITKCFQICM